MPSACTGVHASVGTHCEPHPAQPSIGASYGAGTGAQSHSWRQGAMASGTLPSLRDMNDVRLTAFVTGRVQGVGFRWWTRSRALELGLAGRATNCADGRVEVVAEGPEPACRALLEQLARGPGRVDVVAELWSAARGETGFVEA